MTGKTTCYVLDEHTLGYVNDAYPHIFGVLQGDVFKGGHDWKNGFTIPSRLSQLRPATLADFDRFRVSPTGYFD